MTVKYIPRDDDCDRFEKTHLTPGSHRYVPEEYIAEYVSHLLMFMIDPVPFLRKQLDG